MRWLHTWTGLVLGWLLFAIFLTGTLAFFQFEITRWMQPELDKPASQINAVAQAQTFLNSHAANASSWSISVPNARQTTTQLYWRPNDPGVRGYQSATLDGTGQDIDIRDTRGGNFLYRFHFDLHYMPVLWARWLVGIAAMSMLVAIVSGVVIHKKIFKDFFTFKLGVNMRNWLDAHTLTSVLALPFHFMITYTGLVTLMLMYFIWAINLSYGDRSQLFDELNSSAVIPEASGVAAPLTELQVLYDDARARLRGAEVSFIAVHHPGDSNSTIEFTQAPTDRLVSDYRKLVYSATSGELLSDAPVQSVAEHTRRVMINLHAGRFADLSLRWLYFISGIVGTMMVASGLVLWVKKREKASHHAGSRLVRTLNFGTLIGLPFGVGCFFLANRLIDPATSDRANLEIDMMFVGWGTMLLFGMLRPSSRHWLEGAVITAVLFLLLPVTSLFTVSKHLGNYHLPQDNVMLFMDIALILTGLMFAYIAMKMHSRQSAMKGVECRS